MERTKKCRYCGTEFKAKRIDAKYCSESCRQMVYRRKSDPHTYGKVVPIFFELDDHEYEDLLKRADEMEMHPNDFMKKLVTDENAVNVPFTSDQRNDLNNIRLKYRGVTAEYLIHRWTIARLEKELEEWDGSINHPL